MNIAWYSEGFGIYPYGGEWTNDDAIAEPDRICAPAPRY